MRALLTYYVRVHSTKFLNLTTHLLMPLPIITTCNLQHEPGKLRHKLFQSVLRGEPVLRGFVLYFSSMDNQIQAKMDPDEEIEGFRVVVQSLGIPHNFRGLKFF
jgi:hypothetical protein